MRSLVLPGLVRALLLVLVAGTLAATSAGPASAVPTRQEWLKDVNRVMKPAGPYLKERLGAAEQAGETGLALNLDIDNSTLTSYYDGDDLTAIRRVQRFTDRATANGVALLFNTGRLGTARKRKETKAQLAAAGYDVTMLCMRGKGEALAAGKQRCRDRFAAMGYTLIANIGNNPTDFEGDGYERAFRLPNYRGTLG